MSDIILLEFLPLQSSSSSSSITTAAMSAKSSRNSNNGDQWTEEHDEKENEGELRTSVSVFKSRGVKRM